MDIQAGFKYFARVQNSDLKSFCVIDINGDARVRNLFWAAYESFVNSITFDTTYPINKYKMPWFCLWE